MSEEAAFYLFRLWCAAHREELTKRVDEMMRRDTLQTGNPECFIKADPVGVSSFESDPNWCSLESSRIQPCPDTGVRIALLGRAGGGSKRVFNLSARLRLPALGSWTKAVSDGESSPHKRLGA